MLPLYILTSAKTQPVMVELKNGETLNGLLTNCDSWMNLTLTDVIQTSADGKTFLKVPESYVRGTHIKYLRLPEQSMDHAKEQSMISMDSRNKNNQRRRGNFRRGNGRDFRDHRDHREGYARDGQRDGRDGRDHNGNRDGRDRNFRRGGYRQSA